MTLRRLTAKTLAASVGATLAFVGVVCADSLIGTGRYSTATGDMLNSLGVKMQARAANNAEMNAYKWGGRITRDGFATAGDGGQATYTHSASACTISGGDGGSQIPSGTGGCFNIDWSSVGFVATPNLFVASFGSNSAADTAAVQKAINTGRRVLIPSSFTASGPLTCSTAKQNIGGLGRGVTIVSVPSTFSTSAAGVFVSAASPTGCEFRDFQVTFAQPDTTDINAIVKYPPAFAAVGQPGLFYGNIGCYFAWTCFSATGNSGNSRWDNVEAAAFNAGWYLDGALDSMRLTEVHGFPFGMSNNQQTLVNNNATWLKIGRVDDLQVDGALFILGTAADLRPSADGNCSSTSFTNTQFDNNRIGLNVVCGLITISGGYIASDLPGSPVGVNQTGGVLTISAQRFMTMGGQTPSSGTPYVTIAGNHNTSAQKHDNSFVTCVYYAYCGYPVFTLNNTFVPLKNDQPFFILYEGVANLNNNTFRQAYTTADGAPANITSAFTYTKIYTARNSGQTARLTAIGNRINDRAVSGGVFIGASASSDDFSKWVFNTAPGWNYAAPTGSTGTYSPN